MAQPYIGEIRLFAGNYAPAEWAFCDGSLQPISGNEPLFNLIGTTYGGDGQTTFALPDLRSRVPVHQGTASSGQAYVIGENGGAESVMLTTAQLPAHSHTVVPTTTGTASAPAANLALSNQTSPSPASIPVYAAPNTATLAPLASQAVANQGGGQPHDNMPPYLALNFIIALFGIYPNQS